MWLSWGFDNKGERIQKKKIKRGQETGEKTDQDQETERNKRGIGISEQKTQTPGVTVKTQRMGTRS